jgi:hypothetical protein
MTEPSEDTPGGAVRVQARCCLKGCLMPRGIERTANIAIIVLCAIVAVQAVRKFRDPAPRSISPPKAGERLAAIPSVDYGTAPLTLVMALRQSCKYCAESMPFYRDLVTQRTKRGVPLRLVVVAPESKSETETYLRDQHLSVDMVVQSELSRISVPGTPTLILVDRQGVVRGSWIGKISVDQEAIVRGAILGS